MKKEDLIEIDKVQYLVYDEKEIKGKTYYLLCPVVEEKVIEDKEIYTELLDYFKQETGRF